jgi:hypothetical protein
MKQLLRSMLACLTVIYCMSAGAAVQPSVLNTTDSGCVVDGSTSGCFSYSSPTGTAYSGPTATKCIAYGKQNQRCRECVRAYDDNGNYAGYSVCAYVSWAASCGCKNALTASCSGYGTCNYTIW